MWWMTSFQVTIPPQISRNVLPRGSRYAEVRASLTDIRKAIWQLIWHSANARRHLRPTYSAREMAIAKIGMLALHVVEYRLYETLNRDH